MTDTFIETDERAREISDNVARVREQIARATERSGREENAVTLCAVTKTRPVRDCLAAVQAGIQDVGENYVQEAREKIPALRSLLPDNVSLKCHLIGHLQTNKIKYAVRFADIFQTVDSEECLQGIAKSTQKLYNDANIVTGNFQQARVLIEINLSGDAGRAGVSPEHALDLVGQAQKMQGVALCGLMGMAPAVENSDAARPYFARLKTLFDALPSANRQILSMGMSGDFQAAIQEGATLVRIGTAIFGARNR